MNLIMKKTIVVFSILVTFCGCLCGCSFAHNIYPSTESYENEDFETVNTSRVDSTYSLSPVMRELRKSVMEMLGEYESLDELNYLAFFKKKPVIFFYEK